MTRGCNLKCGFCPIAVLPAYSTDKQYLTPALCAHLAPEIATVHPSPRIELTMRGEPTLNPHLLENLALLRAALPHAQITLFSNGVRFLKDPAPLKSLFGFGLNILAIDCYNGTYDRFAALVQAAFAQTDVSVRDFRSFSAYKAYPQGHTLKVCVLVPDIADPAHLVTVRVLHNNGGNADPQALQERYGIAPLAAPLPKKCARPFRELVLAYNGDVLLCCHDWRAEAVLGSTVTTPLRDIWYGAAHLAALQALYVGDRSAPPCSKCDYHGGYRLGFLHNPNVDGRRQD
jgi:MoaA/NifB/PqqE/SkfB family radical SAM enzyme